MSFYEHTIVARQDASSKQLADFEDKYSNLLKDHSGKLIKMKIQLDKLVIKDLVIKYKKLDLKTEYFRKDK